MKIVALPTIALVMGVALTVGCASGNEALKNKAERVITITRNERRGLEKTIPAAFDAIDPVDLTPGRIKTYDTRTVELLFEATAITADYSERPELTPAMEDAFEEAYKRGFIGDMVKQLHTRYVTERRWDKARALYERFPGSLKDPEVPEPSTPVSGPAVYEVAPDGKFMTLKPLDIKSRPLIVAVVSGGCHFSQDADAAIAADPGLSQALTENAIYVDPSRYSLPLEELAENNRTQKYKVFVLYKASGFGGLDFRQTPHFYFLNDGRVVHDVLGMGPDITAELREGLTRIGLTATSSR